MITNFWNLQKRDNFTVYLLATQFIHSLLSSIQCTVYWMSEYGRSAIYIECHFKVSLSVLYFVYVCDRGMGYHCTLYEHLWHVCMWKNTRCYVRYWIGLNDTCGDWNVWHGRSHSFRTVNYSYNHLFRSDLPKLSVLIEQHVANFDNLRNFGVWTYSWKNISEKFYSSRDIELNVEKETNHYYNKCNDSLQTLEQYERVYLKGYGDFSAFPNIIQLTSLL